jgi:hypothetical protein
MRKLLLPVFLAASLALGACADGGVGFGSIRLPGLGAPPTAEEQAKLGSLGERYAALRERVDVLLARTTGDRMESKVAQEFVRLMDDANLKVKQLARDPADNKTRVQVITVLTDLERLLIAHE